MLHWPLCPSWVENVRSTLDEAWRAMERLLEEGTCRAIGVSNFSVKELVELMDNCSVVPHVSRLHNIGFDLFFHSTEVDESFCRWISASSIPIKIPKNWGHSVERTVSYSRFVRSSTLNDHSKWNAMIVIQGLLSAGKWNNIEGDSGCTSGWNG